MHLLPSHPLYEIYSELVHMLELATNPHMVCGYDMDIETDSPEHRALIETLKNEIDSFAKYIDSIPPEFLRMI